MRDARRTLACDGRQIAKFGEASRPVAHQPTVVQLISRSRGEHQRHRLLVAATQRRFGERQDRCQSAARWIIAGSAGPLDNAAAKLAGLDATAFNKSKRITADGRERWPSTESLAKALAATGSSMDTYVQLIGDHAREVQSVPLPPGTPIRRGDRVVVKTVAGEVLIRELRRRTAKALELAPFEAGEADRTLDPAEIEWIARIVWTRH